MTQLPEIFLQQMQNLLPPEEFLAFCKTYEKPTVRGLRLNRLKAVPPFFTVAEKNSTGDCESPVENFIDLPKVPWCADGRIYSDSWRPAKSIFHHAGLFYIQEPSAMCPVEVLAPQPGDRVLDLCAAPGGKSAQIAGYLVGGGLLLSNDASPSRSRALVKNLERMGVTNAVVTTEQPKKLADRFPAFFDKILVDAPCSGEGMFRRDADAVKAYTANKPEACVAMQTEILRYAARMLKPGGRLVYSTCTFNTKENEDVIADFLNNNADFALIPIDHEALGISRGIGLPQTGRIFPHLADGEGHFVALLTKDFTGNSFKRSKMLPASVKFSHADDTGQGRPLQEPNHLQNASAIGAVSNHPPTANTYIPKEFAQFCKEYITVADFPMGQIVGIHGRGGSSEFRTTRPCNQAAGHQNPKGSRISNDQTSHGANLYLSPEPLDLHGLRVARSGWFLGECAKGRFVPSHALAMGLRKEDVRYAVELSEENAWRYLRGESLDAGGMFEQIPQGKSWVMVCYKSLPLGWTKLVQGRLKNNLPTGLVVK